MWNIDTYAVIGNPISHSKSPLIHTEFAKQTGQRLRYIAIEAPLSQFKQTALDFQQRGGNGLNVTVPFKQQAWELVSACSERAQIAGAVNTLVFQAGKRAYGDNTDGVGLIRDIVNNQHLALQQKKILLIGAGGAACGVLGALLAEKPDLLVLTNRTLNKAQALAQQFSQIGRVQANSLQELVGQSFDLIINATSASLTAEIPAIPTSSVTPHTFCYDLMYAKSPTVFLRWAQQCGAQRWADGLGMLVEQAAEAFYLWRGVKPDTQPVLKLLRSEVYHG